MKFIVKMFFVFFGVSFSFIAYSESDSLYCNNSLIPTTKIYFVNGVWNTDTQARLSLAVLERAYRPEVEEKYPEEVFDFRLAYNYNVSKVQDLVEVIAQKERELGLESANLTPRQYLTLYMTAQTSNGEFDESLPPALRSRFLSIAVEDYFAAQFTEAINSDEIVQKFRNDLMEGARLLAFAHSQGNMYVVEAMSILMNEYSVNMSMIGIASPAGEIYNGSDYFTAHDDRVINKMRDYYDVLPSNVDNDPGIFGDNRDISNHQLIPSYFEESLVSRSLIDGAFFRQITSLQFPTAIVNPGIITATLTWGEQPDVDLHTFEPNGAHVYYFNRYGTSGYLDLDDTSSYGPEHYYVSCNSLEIGTYTVGINYYNGSAPETALIQISAGSSVRSFSIDLQTAVGSSGNDSPVAVADIVVTGSAEDGYGFSIENRVPAINLVDGVISFTEF